MVYVTLWSLPPLKGVNTYKEPREQTTSYGAPQAGPTIALPTAVVGNPVPYFVGKQRIASPNVIEYANIQALTNTTYVTKQTSELKQEVKDVAGVLVHTDTTVTKITTTAETTVIGYTCDVLLALALGPGVRLTAILADGSPIWTGDVGEGGSGTIPAGDLFVSGSQFTFHSGEFNQSPYVGISYIKFASLRADKPFSSLQFDITRYPNPLGLSTSRNKMGDDISIASAIAEIITNSWGGAGADISTIDVASFTAAAETLYSEGNKCSLLILDTFDVKSIIGILQKQAGGLVTQNTSTGKLEFNLTRAKAVNVGNALQLNNSSIVELRSVAKPGWQETVEQLRGTYTDRVAGYAPVPLFTQNISNLSQSGRGKRTGTVDYPTVMDKDLAIKLLSRDMARMSSPMYTLEVVTDRAAAKAKPGDICVVNYFKYKMYSALTTIDKVRKQPLDSNLVSLSLSLFPLNDETVLFTAPNDPDVLPDPTKPVKPTSVLFYMAPYFMARKVNGAINSTTTDAGVFALLLPKPANNYQTSFASYIGNVPGTSGDVQTGLTGAYSTFAELGAALPKSSGVSNGLVAEVLISNIINPSNLINVGAQGVVDGQVLVFAGDEIFSFESFANVGPNQWKLYNVRRGLLDTSPTDHALGDPIYIVGSNYSFVTGKQFEYPLGYLPQWKIVSNTAIQIGNKSDALLSSGFTPDFNRTMVPVRPHDTRIDGNRYYDGTYTIYSGQTATVTWKTRNRTSLSVMRQSDAAEDGEVDANTAFQVHRVKMRDSLGIVYDLGVTANDGNYNTKSVTIPVGASLGIAALWVQAETVNGVSRYNDEINFTVIPTYAIVDETGNNFLSNENGISYLTLEGS